MSLATTTWICSPFVALDHDALYELLKLRAEVFVVEQNCAYQDLDGHDREALHLRGLIAGEVVCYARLNPPGAKSPHATISRVLTKKRFRAAGLGRRLLREALARCGEQWPNVVVELSAQAHLVHLYVSLGFRPISDPYDHEGIPHVDMLRDSTGRASLV